MHARLQSIRIITNKLGIVAPPHVAAAAAPALAPPDASAMDTLASAVFLPVRVPEVDQVDCKASLFPQTNNLNVESIVALQHHQSSPHFTIAEEFTDLHP